MLTSSRTFSGGEDLAYTLQALSRGEVIGETTCGGAHPTRPFPISAAVHIGIPFARSMNGAARPDCPAANLGPATEGPPPAADPAK